MGVTLYTGGCRSGKSSMALEHARKLSEKVCFVATCVPQDEEMRLRVKKHQENRPASWDVIEEPLELAQSIKSVNSGHCPVILVDCLALWICNLMSREENAINSEQEMAVEAENVIQASREYGGEVILVSNEVGMGIMPVNDMARKYGDLVGRCNQVIASRADRVILASCGIGITLKQEL